MPKPIERESGILSQEMFKANLLLTTFAQQAGLILVIPFRVDCGFIGLQPGKTRTSSDTIGVTVVAMDLTPVEVQEVVDFMQIFALRRKSAEN